MTFMFPILEGKSVEHWFFPPWAQLFKAWLSYSLINVNYDLSLITKIFSQRFSPFRLFFSISLKLALKGIF